MMRHPPEYVPSEIAAAAASFTQSGMPSSALGPADGEQRQEDDAHRLLRVLQAVAERHRGGRHGLREAEPPRGRASASAGRKIHSTPTMTTNARPKPTSGEMIIGRTTLSTIADQ